MSLSAGGNSLLMLYRTAVFPTLVLKSEKLSFSERILVHGEFCIGKHELL